MRLLLDTHVAIWAVAGTRRLPAPIAKLLGHPGNEVWVSAVSLAEIAIKFALMCSGVGAMPYSAEEALDRFETSGFDMLNLTPGHTVVLQAMPPLHRDPFDRLLVAQAFHEPMRLVTSDAAVAAYSDQIIHF